MDGHTKCVSIYFLQEYVSSDAGHSSILVETQGYSNAATQQSQQSGGGGGGSSTSSVGKNGQDGGGGGSYYGGSGSGRQSAGDDPSEPNYGPLGKKKKKLKKRIDRKNGRSFLCKMIKMGCFFGWIYFILLGCWVM